MSGLCAFILTVAGILVHVGGLPRRATELKPLKRIIAIVCARRSRHAEVSSDDGTVPKMFSTVPL